MLLALGLNHKTAPVDIREKLAFDPNVLHDALENLNQHHAVNEAAILSTCNRTELYCDIQNDQQDSIFSWLHNYHQLQPELIQPYIFFHENQQAIRHMLRVASGLDSLVLGEPQILGQMKDAYHSARQANTLKTLLDKLFQHTFHVAKQVRTDTSIGHNPVSVAFSAVALSKQIFGELDKYTALLIGAGETTELVARHLKEKQMGRMIVANRTLERARHLAVEMDAYAITLQEISQHLSEVDIVIASTASPEPILDKLAVQTAMQQRKHKPMLLIDIAVPRDIAADVEIAGGPGDDEIGLTSFSVGGQVRISTGRGDDTVVLNDVSVNQKTRINYRLI